MPMMSQRFSPSTAIGTSSRKQVKHLKSSQVKQMESVLTGRKSRQFEDSPTQKAKKTTPVKKA